MVVGVASCTGCGCICRAVVNWLLQPDTKGEKGGLSQMVRPC